MDLFNIPFFRSYEADLGWVMRKIKELTKKVDDLYHYGLYDFVEKVLTAHPEWTTTVMDGSITENKINNVFLRVIKNWYVCPEMFGAVGDGETDDTEAFQTALDSGKRVFLYSNAVYRLNNLLIGDDTYLIGNGATIKGSGAGQLLTVRTYEDPTAQEHEDLPVLIKEAILTDANTLIGINQAIKVTVKDMVFKNFNTGIHMTAGYENVFGNLRFEGNPNDNTQTAIKIEGGGDSIFDTVTGRDVDVPIDVRTANNTFRNFHFWIRTAALYETSIFIKENAGTASANKYIDFYFDNFKTMLQQNGYSFTQMIRPYIYIQTPVASTEATLVDMVNTDFENYIENRLIIRDAIFNMSSSQVCNICSSNTAPINMTFMPCSAAQYEKIEAANVINRYDKIHKITVDRVFTMNSGYTIKTGNAYIDYYNKHVWGDAVIESSTALYGGNSVTIGSPALTPFPGTVVNGAAFVSTSEWSTQEVAYMYMSNTALQIKPNTDGHKFIKFSFDFMYK